MPLQPLPDRRIQQFHPGPQHIGGKAVHGEVLDHRLHGPLEVAVVPVVKQDIPRVLPRLKPESLAFDPHLPVSLELQRPARGSELLPSAVDRRPQRPLKVRRGHVSRLEVRRGQVGDVVRNQLLPTRSKLHRPLQRGQGFRVQQVVDQHAEGFRKSLANADGVAPSPALDIPGGYNRPGMPSAAARNPDLRLRVTQIIDRIRPAVQSDGGDVELLDVNEKGVVTIRLHGACVGCPSSQLTLKVGIEKNLKDHVPEVTQVVALD